MSAFICNPRTYSDIYSGLRVYGQGDKYPVIEAKVSDITSEIRANEIMGDNSDIYARLIRKWYTKNVEAVNQRYGDSTTLALTDQELKEMKKFNPLINMYQFLKSLDCLHYQMCEGDIPETQEYKDIAELRKAISHYLKRESTEYDKASWGR